MALQHAPCSRETDTVKNTNTLVLGVMNHARLDRTQIAVKRPPRPPRLARLLRLLKDPKK